MITLFVKTGCPYCAKAITALDTSGISYEKKNIADEDVLEELITQGGKHQVPFLIDGETMLYESDVIVSYVEHTYGKGTSKINSSPIRIHKSNDTDVCHTE